MFERLLRLSYPSVSLSRVYNKCSKVIDSIRWMYDDLVDSPTDEQQQDIGLAHAVQVIDVRADEHSPRKDGY